MDLDNSINNLPIDLKTIKLSRDNISIEGKGMIYNKDQESLAVKIFVDKCNDFDPAKYVVNQLSIKAGEEINDTIYFALEGESLSGDTLYCDRVVLYDNINSEIVDSLLIDYLTISSDQSFTKYNMGKIIIPYEIAIPKNRAIEIFRNFSNKWSTKNIGLRLFETTVNNIDIDVLSENEKTVIYFKTETQEFSSKDDLQPIIDSLSFLSSTIINRYDIELASYRMRASKKIICSKYAKYNIIKMNFPPLDFDLSIDQCENHCDLFNKFYLFSRTKESSELKYAIKKVISSSNYTSNFALSITAAIEALAKKYFKEYAREIDPEQVTLAHQNIKALDINKEIKDRISGMLNSIVGQIRAKDVLVKLSEEHIIDKEEHKAWTKLRNSSVHGDENKSTFQDYYNLCSLNITLYYKLIFAIIGYHGLFSDYSKLGYPIRELNNAS